MSVNPGKDVMPDLMTKLLEEFKKPALGYLRVEKPKKPSKKSQLEDSFFAELKLYGVPTPVRQHLFHPTRKWRFDFAWIEQKIAVEIHGGIFVGGAHSRGAFMEKSFEKENAAQLLGWKVFIFGPSQIRGKKRIQQASPACEFLWKIFHPHALGA